MKIEAYGDSIRSARLEGHQVYAMPIKIYHALLESVEQEPGIGQTSIDLIYNELLKSAGKLEEGQHIEGNCWISQQTIYLIPRISSDPEDMLPFIEKLSQVF